MGHAVCCSSGEPSHLIPLGMTSIAVPGLLEPWSQAFSAHTTAVAGGLKWSAAGSASESQTGDHSTVRRMLSSARDSLDQAAVSSAVPKSPGIPVDFEVQQPKLRSAKKRRISGGQGGGQTTVDQAGPAVAVSCLKMGDGLCQRQNCFQQDKWRILSNREATYVRNSGHGRQGIHTSPQGFP